jgi:tetratricopeptide (TPR) repeat protein
MRALLVAVISSTLCCAEWIRFDSAGIELFTDAGEKSGRQIMTRFEQIREIFRQAGIAPGPLRVRVFAFTSAEEFHRYRQDAGGFYQSGPECDYIALPIGPEADRVAFHEYVHLVLTHSAVPLPPWFDEGMAEFYSTVQIEKDGLRIGDAIPSHIALLSKERWLDAAELGGRPQGSIFYAESWALVHMLNLASGWRDGMPQFVSLLAEEKPAEEAFHEAFGKTVAEALSALHAYSKSMRSVAIPAILDVPEKVEVVRLTNDAALLARAGLALSVKRAELAKTLVNALPASPEAEAMRGAMALAENRRDEARGHLDRAIELGSRDPALYFEYAMLERESGRSDMEFLRKVIELDPDFADAQFLIGVRETDDGTYVSAIDHLRVATRVKPGKSTYWHALAYAQAKSGDRQAALVSARRAIARAETDQEEQMARALLTLPAEDPAPRASRRSVITPPSWKARRGDARIEGTLVDFDCTGDRPRLQIRVDSGSSVTLRLQHPSEVELVNAPQASLQLPCGALNLRVVIDYESGSSDVTRIEFRL